jgi:hypothetical protein
MYHGIALTEDSILQQLAAIVEDLEAVKLSMLAFERLVKPARVGDSEPWAAFGRSRVNDTGVHLASCEDAIKRRNADVARMSAQRALARWIEQKGE